MEVEQPISWQSVLDLTEYHYNDTSIQPVEDRVLSFIRSYKAGLLVSLSRECFYSLLLFQKHNIRTCYYWGTIACPNPEICT